MMKYAGGQVFDDDMKPLDVEPDDMPAKGAKEAKGGLPPEVKASDDKMHRATVDSLGSGAPPATSPLSAERVARLAGALSAAVDELGNGEIEFDAPVADGDEPLDQLPPETFAGLKALRAALDEVGGKAAAKYDFDPNDATSDQGVEAILSQVTAMATDTRLLAQMAGGTGKGGGEKAPPMKDSKGPPKGPPKAEEKPKADKFEGLYD